jgi:hypothetical protein
MIKVFIDTSGWAALFVKNDINHKKAVTIFAELKDSQASLYTSDYVIDETITVISARSSHQQSVFAGNVLFSSKIVRNIYVSPQYLESAWKLYQKYYDKEFSFTDVTSFVIVKDMGIEKVFSFDRNFQQAGFKLW